MVVQASLKVVDIYGRARLIKFFWANTDVFHYRCWYWYFCITQTTAVTQCSAFFFIRSH